MGGKHGYRFSTGLVDEQAYVPHLLPPLVLQALPDGYSIRFVTLGGVEICRIMTAPEDRLANVYSQLKSCSARKPGSIFAAIDAVLPGGGLLSGVSASQTVASFFDLGP